MMAAILRFMAVPLENKRVRSSLDVRDFVTHARTRINAALGLLESAGAIGRTADRLFCDKAKLAQAARMDTTS